MIKDGDNEGIDDDEGCVDKLQLLSEEERRQLDASVLPIRVVITKVCSSNSRSVGG